MNIKRKKELQKLADRIYEVKEILEKILDDEQEYFDNIPENLENSERYEISENAIESMENCIDNLDDAVLDISEIL